MDSRYTRFGKNTILVVLGNVGSKFLSFLMLPFYTKWLPVADYGTVDIIGIYVSFLIGVATCAIAEAVFVFPKGQEIEKQKIYFSSGLNFMLFAFGLILLLFEGTKYIAKASDISNSFVDNIWLVYGILITTAFQQYIQQFTRSIDKIFVYSVSGLVLTVLTIIFSFLLIPNLGVLGYVFAICIANLLTAFYSMIASGSIKYYSPFVASISSCKEMLRYSTPLVPNNLMWWLVSALNRPVIEAFLGIEAIGLFAVANKFPSVLSNAFAMFAVSWQISVLEEFWKPGYKKFFNNVFRWVVFSMILLSCILSILSSTIIEHFADARYYESWRYIPVLTLSSVFMAVSGFAGSNFSATKESKYFFYSSAWGALVAVVANFVLIPTVGTMGASISVALSFLAMSFSRCFYCWKYVKIENLGRIVASLLSNIAIIISVLYIESCMTKCVLIVFFFGVIMLANIDIVKQPIKLLKK